MIKFLSVKNIIWAYALFICLKMYNVFTGADSSELNIDNLLETITFVFKYHGIQILIISILLEIYRIKLNNNISKTIFMAGGIFLWVCSLLLVSFVFLDTERTILEAVFNGIFYGFVISAWHMSMVKEEYNGI